MSLLTSVKEGDSGSQTITFTISRSGFITNNASSVDFNITGSALESSDYTFNGSSDVTTTSGTINFAAGETSKTIILDVLGDTDFETKETIEVTLSNASAGVPTSISTDIATSTILTDELVVDTLVDENDGVGVGNGTSLREALDAIADEGTITFAQSIADGTITLTQGQFIIDKPLTIDGDEENITISGNNASRVFNIDDSSNDIQAVHINGLTISDGSVNGNGGGIFNRENLTLSNSTIANNSASRGGRGGGIYNYSGTVSISNSNISDNYASSYGGGIFNTLGTTASISNSTISDNSASIGGGIYNYDGRANISNSTISDNSAFRGGGILNNDGTANISNSTISDNSASIGGGIYNREGRANISNSTISNNSATNNGGGIYNYNRTANIISSIVSGNNATNSGDEVYNDGGTVNANNNNLFGDSGKDNSNAFNGFTPSGTDITATSDGTNPTALDDILDPNGLQDNGGPTQTIALQEGSLAANAGSNPDNLDNDQRGTGFERVIGGITDIGAFESDILLSEIVVDTLEDEDDGDFSEGDRSLREALLYMGDGGTITFASDLATEDIGNGAGVIALSGTQLIIDKSVNIDGDIDSDGTGDITVSGNNTSQVFNIDDGTVTVQTVKSRGFNHHRRSYPI